MKKKAFGFTMILLLLFSFSTVVKAEVELLYGNIIQKGLSSGVSQTLQLKIADTSGEQTIYNCSKKVRVNSVTYEPEEAVQVISDGSFAKIVLVDGVITKINAASDYVSFENVSYDEKSRLFKGLRKRVTGLPVYCIYNGNFVPAYPDENHLYDINVYDYAICITGIHPKTEKEVLEYIDISSGIDKNFNQNIDIYCETGSADELVLKGVLYNKNDEIILSEEYSGCSEFELYFTGLENRTEDYTIKLCLEDTEGNRVSSVYTRRHSVEAAEVVYEYILQKEITTGINEIFQIKTSDSAGKTSIYTVKERGFVNGVRCKTVEEFNEAVGVDVFAKMALTDGAVSVIAYGTASDTYEKVTHTEIEEKNLPVFYKYNDSFSAAYLDENHLYDIEVYGYAVCVTDMQALDDKKTIKYMDTGSSISKNFTQNINVYCETDTDENSVLKGELYKDEALLESAQSITGEFELDFAGLENKTEDYTLKLWLEDAEGNRISHIYTRKHSVEAADIIYEYILKKGITTDIDEIFQIKTSDSAGKTSVYTVKEKGFVNGTRCKTVEELDAAVEAEAFAKIALTDGIVSVIAYDAEPQTYENTSHDDIKSKNLPVFYKYNDSFAMAYLDENHLYDIEVYDYAVCITDMTAKDMPETIKYIDVYDGINRKFERCIGIECETDSSGEYTLVAEIADKKSQRIKKGQTVGSGNFYLEFYDLKNPSGNYTIRLWLEDGEKNRVSNVYILNREISHNEILYGDVVIKYTRSNNGEEEEVLNIRDIDGNERHFVCDENIEVITSAALFSTSGEEAEIPENTFVKFAAKDGVINTIQIGMDTLEVSAGDFISKDKGIEGSVSVMNNTETEASFLCIAAVFDSSNKLKKIVNTAVEIDAATDKVIYPDFEDYSFSEGDYVRIFSWNGETALPVFTSLEKTVIEE